MSESIYAIRLATFKDSRESFLSALEDAGIRTGEVKLFSERPQAAGFVGMVYAVSEALPWNALSKVIVAWLDARKSREIIITQGANTVIHARGYSVEDLQKILGSARNITAIDTAKPDSDV